MAQLFFGKARHLRGKLKRREERDGEMGRCSRRPMHSDSAITLRRSTRAVISIMLAFIKHLVIILLISYLFGHAPKHRGRVRMFRKLAPDEPRSCQIRK
jgi:hypothetical protein